MRSSKHGSHRILLPIVLGAISLSAGCTAAEETYDVYGGDQSIEDVWDVWSHEGLVSVERSQDTKVRSRSIRIEHPDVEPTGYQDWSLENRERLVDVTPGEEWTASAWVKYEDTGRIGIEIIALSNGEPVGNWTSGFAAAYGTGEWELLEASALIPPGSDQIRVRLSGSGKTLAWVDDVRLRRGRAERRSEPRPEVEGWAFGQSRVQERLDRGLVAVPREDGSVYLTWRLLRNDPENIAFNVYRASGDDEPVKLTLRPISTTTDFIDTEANLETENAYFVRPVAGNTEGDASERVTVEAEPEPLPYLSVKLQGNETTFNKVGIGDLNGDGRYDFVIKTPNSTIDPYHTSRYWKPSETTYKLEAYLSDGTFLWRKDLGWNIEAGGWYSPYVVFDFDGDGRAEVAVKTGPADQDLRDTEPAENGLYAAGRVTSGPEYVSVLDGMTGEETARADWPSRAGLGMYSHFSRNLMGVAYLDGKTPALVLARGTYTVNKLATYQYAGGELEELWTWDSTHEPGGMYYGQGDHFIHAADVDGDGRDEIVLGAAVIDSNGDGLWSSGLGHSDNVWVGDINPARPGLEIYLGIEGARVKGSVRHGISLRDAGTGEVLWGIDRPTYHVHSSGLVSDIDPRHPGMEAYSGEKDHPDRWLHSAQGELIADRETFNAGLAPKAIYWDATPQRELLLRSRIFKFPDETISDVVEGHQTAWLDLLGDWREEIITSVPGALRIYTTPIPARDRRVTLMQDPLYRSGAAHLSMGYGQQPMTSYFIGPQEPVATR